MIASVSGMRSAMVDPSPASLAMSIAAREALDRALDDVHANAAP